jgi:GTPase KRas
MKNTGEFLSLQFTMGGNSDESFIRELRDQCISESEGFMLVYSIAQRESFQEMTSVYENILRIKGRDRVPVILVGNKSDKKIERQVSTNG